MAAKRIIYGLVDPRCGSVRYVGKSTRGLKRPKEHKCDRTRTKRGAWVRKLNRLGLEYGIVVLESEPEDLNQAEKWWIEAARAAHGDLVTNLSVGGEGVEGLRCSAKTRAKLSAVRKGKKHTPETRAKMSDARKGKRKSPEHRAKISAAHQGKKRGPLSSEHRSKIGVAHKGMKRSPEARANISAALKRHYAEKRAA